MEKFVQRVTTNEAFREELGASPMDILSDCGLSDEDIHSIKNDHAWEWLRKGWSLP